MSLLPPYRVMSLRIFRVILCFWGPATKYLTRRTYNSDIKSQSQSASRSWCQAPIWDPKTNFSHSLFDYFLDSFGFVDVGRPLWREVGSVLSSFCRASPAQPFSDLSPTGLMSIVYCLYFWDSPNLEGQVPVFISPRNRVAQLYPRALG
jgi:hypothetical protein